MARMMVSAVALAAVMSTSAAMADGYERGPRYAAPCCAPSWSGFYLGAGVGYGSFVESETTVNTATGIPDHPSTDFGGKGVLGTVIVGYDHQIGNLVLGAFADFDWSGAKGTMSDIAGGPTLWGSVEQDSAWAVGGRAGLLTGPKTLVYLSGGYTQAKFDSFSLSSISGATVRSADSQTHNGWFLGAGMETKLVDNLSLRLEYRFSDYGEKSFDRFVEPAHTLSTSHYLVDLTEQTGRVVLAYKFGREEPRPLK